MQVGKKTADAGKQWVRKEDGIWWPSKAMKEKAYVSDPEIYRKAMADPVKFWAEKAKLIDWFNSEWKKTEEWKPPYFKWFEGATTNISYNCLDRHLPKKASNPALIWQPEPLEEKERILTYKELSAKVQRFSNVLNSLGVKKGQAVTLWMPMIPETAIAALACQRIGAWHSIVYTAFSPHQVKERMKNTDSKILITVDGFYRRGKVIKLKEKIDDVLDEIGATSCIVTQRAGLKLSMKKGRDYWWHELISKANKISKPVELDSEDTSFILYTSGTPGKPHAVKHSIGGYLVQTALTMKWIFDFHPEDIFFSTADIGWITGHSYTLYAPLLLGGTTIWYEGAPDWPKPDRWWEIIQKFKPTQFYTAPTAIRALRKAGKKWPAKHDLSSVRILGSVGEPIDSDTWLWYFKRIGGGRCPIVDTYWQTETGGIIISSLPGIGPFIPKVAGPPFPGIVCDVLDRKGNPTKPKQTGKLVQLHPFPPGMLRGLYKNPQEYVEKYWKEYGKKIYFTEDGGQKLRLKVGGQLLIQITGRIDDVMEVAAHRLSSAEVESAVEDLPEIVDAAVVGKPHEIKGEVPALFVICKKAKSSIKLKEKIIANVRKKVGPAATPGEIYFVSQLPETESGKIIRRFLRSLLRNERLGDMRTAKNPECLKEIAELVNYKGPQKI